MRVQKEFVKKSRASQSFRDECNINKILNRFSKVCGGDYLQKMHGYAGGTFGDFSGVTDYRSALEQVQRAKEVFLRIPAKVRAVFNNDPAYFLDFCQDPKNLDKLREMGLAKAAVEKAVEQPAAG
jgi:phage internal scaffolding protein